MTDTPKTHPEDPWENRELGATESFSRKASAKHEKSLDDKMDLQIVSIRLQKSLIEELKDLAGEEGLGYQPYVRQLLTNHVRNEKRKRTKNTQLIRK